MFNQSIKENILYGKPDATDEEVKQALVNANAFEFIQKKMDGNINANVGNTGNKLSGG